MPLVSKNFSDIITFTRASTATYFDSAGVLQSAAIDVPRFDYNPATLAARGILIEEQRTNLLLNSDTLSTQSVTVSATAYTLSFYGTGTVTLSGVSTAGPLVGSGAFPTRSILTFTPTAGTLTLTVTGTVQYAQLEAGAFPTSYIPTTTTALTRSADLASVDTLSPWFNATEGTLFAQAEVPVITQTGRTMASIGRAVASAYELIVNITSTVAPGLPTATILASTTQFQYQPTPERFSTKGALAYKTDDSQAAFDGTASATDTSVTLPDQLAKLYIGKRDDITPLNGWLKRLTYYPRRLSQAELESITA